jgi:hypothetical protein
MDEPTESEQRAETQIRRPSFRLISGLEKTGGRNDTYADPLLPERAGKMAWGYFLLEQEMQNSLHLCRLLKKFASKAAADESTGGVASGLR